MIFNADSKSIAIAPKYFLTLGFNLSSNIGDVIFYQITS